MFGWLDSIGHCEGRCCRGPSGTREQLWQVGVAAAQTAATEKAPSDPRNTSPTAPDQRGWGLSRHRIWRQKPYAGDWRPFRRRSPVGGPGGGGGVTETNGRAERWSQDAAAAHQPSKAEAASSKISGFN